MPETTTPSGSGPEPLLAVEFAPGPADLAAIVLFLARRRRPPRLASRLAAAVLGLAVAAAGASALAAILAGRAADAAWTAGSGFAAAVLGFSAIAAGRRLRSLAAGLGARRAFGSGRPPPPPQRLELRPEGLRAASADGETLVRWRAVREVARTPDHLLLFVARGTAFAAPRHAFPDRAAFDAFCSRAEAMRQGAG